MLIYATLKMAGFGFMLACLYYVVFAPRHETPGALESGFSSKLGKFVAIPGFILLLIIAPTIALEGAHMVVAYLESTSLSAQYRGYLAGLWFELAVILGWLLEYEMQKISRNLPKIGFHF